LRADIGERSEKRAGGKCSMGALLTVGFGKGKT